jgi:putative oxidoreductase
VTALAALRRWLIELPERVLPWLHDPFALALRLYVGWPFFHSGMLKLGSWAGTLQQFETDFEVPLLPPHAAAVLGTFGELTFPVLLWTGLATRLAAAGLSVVNVVAAISVVHFFDDGLADPAFADHYLWGLMLAVLLVHGGGRGSLDGLIAYLRRERS